MKIGDILLRRIAVPALALALATTAPASMAAVVELTAKYEPTPGSDSLEFVNTTPITGNCSNGSHRPNCEAAQVWGMAVPGLRGTKTVYTSNTRNRFYIKMPWSSVQVPVTSADGRTFNVKLHIEAAGYRLGDGSGNVIIGSGQHRMANSCTAIVTGTGAGSTSMKSLFILARRSSTSSTCWNTGFANSFILPLFDFEFAYRLEVPAAGSLPNGQYEGEHTFTVGGEGSDFDFGNAVDLNDNSLTVKFKLNVAHQYRIDYPNTTVAAYLSPIGGWDRWLNGGAAPTRMEGEVLFGLTTSSELSIKLQCQHSIGERCGIKNVAESAIVPVDVDVTIPGMSEVGPGGRAANHFPLVVEGTGTAPRFKPSGFMENVRSKLRFVANAPAISEMVETPGSQWQGNVVVVFDANP